jgi:glycosyltransferase involved in cell wall biosynthesis
MTTAPVVSIIMNCYNCEKYLREAIDSVYAQTASDWEIIFFDNSSSDDSAIIAKSYDSRLKYYSSEVTLSLGSARNSALNKASGKYIAFLDCDDQYLQNKIKEQVLYMQKNNCVLSYGGYIKIDENGKLISHNRPKYKNGYLFGKLLKKYDINMQTVMILRSYITSNALNFQSTLKYLPDYNLFMKIASQKSIGVIDSYLVKYRVHPNSLSRKTLDLVAAEGAYTFDSIIKSNPALYNKYQNEFDFAYKKLSYYFAINLINEGEYSNARKVLHKILLASPKFFLLYLLILFNLPKRLVLRLLRR